MCGRDAGEDGGHSRNVEITAGILSASYHISGNGGHVGKENNQLIISMSERRDDKGRTGLSPTKFKQTSWRRHLTPELQFL